MINFLDKLTDQAITIKEHSAPNFSRQNSTSKDLTKDSSDETTRKRSISTSSTGSNVHDGITPKTEPTTPSLRPTLIPFVRRSICASCPNARRWNRGPDRPCQKCAPHGRIANQRTATVVHRVKSVQRSVTPFRPGRYKVGTWPGQRPCRRRTSGRVGRDSRPPSNTWRPGPTSLMDTRPPTAPRRH